MEDNGGQLVGLGALSNGTGKAAEGLDRCTALIPDSGRGGGGGLHQGGEGGVLLICAWVSLEKFQEWHDMTESWATPLLLGESAEEGPRHSPLSTASALALPSSTSSTVAAAAAAAAAAPLGLMLLLDPCPLIPVFTITFSKTTPFSDKSSSALNLATLYSAVPLIRLICAEGMLGEDR
jgi:hypothetical protein